MTKLFAPALFLIRRLTMLSAFSLLGLLSFAQVAVGLWLVGSAIGADTARVLLVVLTFVAAYVLIAIYLWIKVGMDRLRGTIERVASGDLTVRISIGGSNSDDSSELSLWQSVRHMSQTFVEIVGQVRTSADAIVSMAKDIADGNTNLSSRTQEQASSLEETASGMEELAATVKQNANNCTRADTLADTASQVAGKAADQMRELAETMKHIDDSSHRVADILGAIEGIAFQTNILALNAAVEAARAGEQGRGFAVVASEVRSLAQRSAAAAKEIKALIEASVNNVAQGKRLVDAAGGTMGEVVMSVQKVNEVIGEIAMASSEQSAGVDDINKAIVQMDTVTQQNAALVEQAAAAALSFEEEASRLVNVVGAFKLDRMEERDKAVVLVKRAVAHVKAVGVEQASKDFNNPNGGFYEENYYIWSGDYTGMILANGSNPNGAGQNSWELKAADGRKFIQEIIETSKTKGLGWCDYPWKNPTTGRTEQKSTYFESTDNIFVACGIYQGRKYVDRSATQPGSDRKVVGLSDASKRAPR